MASPSGSSGSDVTRRLAEFVIDDGTGSCGESTAAARAADDSESDEDPAFEADPPPYAGQIPLASEQRTALFEILRCAVCLEIPKARSNLQVKVCEKGHHFCTFCHKKLKNCAMCRGRLFSGRNFVVEELISKMGRAFGMHRQWGKTMIPLPIPRGQYLCPHCRMAKFYAKDLLPHIRDTHAENLADNTRTNPCTGWYFANFTTPFLPGERHVWSFQVSDLGLLSLVVEFPRLKTADNLRAWVQMLQVTAENIGTITYRLNITNAQQQSFGFIDLPVLPFNNIDEYYTSVRANCVGPGSFTANEKLTVGVLVFRQSESMIKPPPSWPFFSFDNFMYMSDRKSRRCAARNKRRGRVKKMHTNNTNAANERESERPHDREPPTTCSNM